MLAAIDVQGGNEGGQRVMPELSEQQFVRWASLLEQRLGIAVTPQRKGFLSSKLRSRMRELSLTDFEYYYELVTSPQRGPVEWSRLLDLLTIHETRFNRQPASFTLIEEQILPQLLEQSGGDVINLRAWSVGCASGEEAYYLAMLLDKALQGHKGKGYYGVMGSDVSLESLAQARRGVYPEQRLKGLDKRTVNRYFEAFDGEYRIVDKLRQRVAFSQLNVQNLERAPFEKMDIVFCQNLLIYFSQERRHEVVSKLAQFLKPGGVLILGVGEVIGWQAEGLEPMKIKDTLAYRKIKD
jgi:chemotaxis methyl-accepting protein methylase